MFSNEILPKICPKFYCKNCDYATSKKSSYDDHLLSAKHAKSMIINDTFGKFCPKFFCKNCDKIYKDNSGLWRHTKANKCQKADNTIIEEKSLEPNVTELLLKLLQENMEIRGINLVLKNKDSSIRDRC